MSKENKEIIKSEKKEIAELEKEFDKKLQKYVKTFLVHENLQPEEIEQFIEVAKSQKLDPFKKELHVVVYGKGDYRELSLITGYEVYLRRADLIPDYDYFETEYLGEFGKPDFRCQIKVFSKSKSRPLIHECYFDEFVGRKKDGSVTKFWQKMPRFMIKKVTIGQGLRLAFPNDYKDLPYIKEEIENQIIDVTPEKENNESKLLSIKENMDNDNETPVIMDSTSQELNEDGSKKENSETGSFTTNGSGKIGKNVYTPDNSKKELKKKKASSDKKEKNELFDNEKSPESEKKESSLFDAIEKVKIIFRDERASKLKSLMTKKDKEYFWELATSLFNAKDDKAKDKFRKEYTEEQFRIDMKKIQDYEIEFIKKGGENGK